MYLWRRRANQKWYSRKENELLAFLSTRLAVIEQPNRSRLQLEASCDFKREAEQLVKRFGGRIEKLPRDWRKRFARQQKTKPIEIRKQKLIIPAGAAFGTGEHATTVMSLRLLERLTRKWELGWSLVDLGTGSGILALASKLLGAKRVMGIDNDPTAIRTANENARRNKITNVKFKLVDVRHFKLPARVDIVTANLFSELLIEVLPKLKSASWLIFSGILRAQERDVTQALKRNRFDTVQIRRRGKWVAILAQKRV